ncbi:ribonuclease inhibitor-like [Labeo rohita]|uniref:ribonuclease inhibitor-like n=1 Tax=Labeo rohita TaxID=84645 RepID=UPI0021E3252B|nr:ribonuclease inhibitor-like [Labeo rohita]
MYPSHKTRNDPGQSRVKELSDLLQDELCSLKTIRFLKSPAAEEACEYLTGVLGKSPLLLKELDLSGDKLGDLDGEKLSALLMDSHSKLEKIMLNNCDLTEKSCSVLATVLSSKTNLKEMNLNNSRLLDSGVKEICEGLKNPVCELKILNLNNNCITEGDCHVLAAALNSNPSNLTELDLSENKLGNPGMKIILTLFENVQCRLEKLKLKCISITDEGCAALASAFHSNLRELDLSRNQIGDSGVTEISSLLRNSQCTLQILSLNNNCITEGGCHVLAAALNSNPSNLTELDLSENKLGNPGMKIILTLFENVQCRLEKLKLKCISITDEGCAALASAFHSNLRELDLSRNQIGDSGVTEISSLLRNSQCTLQILRFLKSPAAEEACEYLTGVLGKSPLLLKELDLSGDKLGDLDGEKLSALLMDSHSKLEKIMLNNCDLTEKSCSVLATVLSSKTILKEMNLNNSRLLDSGVKEICEGLKNPVCELKILKAEAERAALRAKAATLDEKLALDVEEANMVAKLKARKERHALECELAAAEAKVKVYKEAI